jgi:hypothetical protein
MSAFLFAATPSQGTNFIAMDYSKPGHPELTFAQMSLIQRTLARVKPCQRPLVRYGLFGPDTKDVILFFAVGPHEGAHPFGTTNQVYFPDEGYSIATNDNGQLEQMKKQGIQWDIDHKPCPHPA